MVDVTHYQVFSDNPVPASEVPTLEGLNLLTHVARAKPLWRRLASLCLLVSS
jgi:hypothetical protein